MSLLTEDVPTEPDKGHFIPLRMVVKHDRNYCDWIVKSGLLEKNIKYKNIRLELIRLLRLD